MRGALRGDGGLLLVEPAEPATEGCRFTQQLAILVRSVQGQVRTNERFNLCFCHCGTPVVRPRTVPILFHSKTSSGKFAIDQGSRAPAKPFFKLFGFIVHKK